MPLARSQVLLMSLNDDAHKKAGESLDRSGTVSKNHVGVVTDDLTVELVN